jgi:hypothetical protein
MDSISIFKFYMIILIFLTNEYYQIIQLLRKNQSLTINKKYHSSVPNIYGTVYILDLGQALIGN